MLQTGTAGTRARPPAPGGGDSAGAFRVLFFRVLFLGAFSSGGRCPARRRLAKGDCHFLRAHLLGDSAVAPCAALVMEYQGLDVRTAGATGWWHLLHGIAMGSGHRPAVSDHPSTALAGLAAGRAPRESRPPKYMLLLLYPPAVALIHRTRSIALTDPPSSSCRHTVRKAMRDHVTTLQASLSL